ncbi:hypothetical protein FALBO_11404 [Fusarium albosuccineum]|uniref:Apple domain-containing protein n=1 Tax=Fusarium albosuccineum TaxID=1237068 RepID=A0A8H4PHV4_9HYPO|nr:hypothetical protein FALBO_11404 [Fusarium albosuccineum]
MHRQVADACPSPSNQHPAAPAETSACSPSNSNDTSSEADATILYEPTPAKNVQNVTLKECQEARAVDTMTMDGYQFEYYCGMDAGYNPDRYPDIKDIVPLIAYYFEDCLKACARMNINNNIQDTNVTCDSVAFSRDMSRRTDENGGNCWLKSGKWIRSKAEGDKLIPEMVYAVVIREEE